MGAADDYTAPVQPKAIDLGIVSLGGEGGGKSSSTWAVGRALAMCCLAFSRAKHGVEAFPPPNPKIKFTFESELKSKSESELLFESESDLP